MKHIVYFIFIWLLFGALISSIAFSLISLVDQVPVREVIKTYDQKLSYLLILQIVGLFVNVITIHIFLREEKLSMLDIGLRFNNAISIFQGFLFGMLPILLIALILYMSNQIDISLNSVEITKQFSYLLIFIIGSVNEEILTRGYVLRYLLLHKGKYSALVLSSLLFALFHIANDNLGFISFLNIFLSGFFLGLFYAYYKNLWFSIAAHFAWNFFQGPIMGSPVSGLKTVSIFKQTLIGNDILTGGSFGFEASIICTASIIVFIFLLHLFCEKNTQGKKFIELQLKSNV